MLKIISFTKKTQQHKLAPSVTTPAANALITMTSTLTQIPTPFFTGLMTSAGLIIAIGAQNAFVLSQGIRRQHPWAIAGLCSLIDTLLIALGILGMGVLISSSEWLMHGVTWAGVAFLLTYGFRALQAAINPSTLNTADTRARRP